MRSYNLEKDFLNKSNCGTGIIYNKETELFDVTLDIKTEHLIKVTWQELVDLKNLSALEPGVFYRITDYEFTSTDPEVISAGHRFDIIVLALSEDTLSEDARAIQHEFTDEEKLIYSEEEQHYFDSSELSAWKLKYSLDGNSSRFSWAPVFYLDTIVFSSQYCGNSYDYYAYSRNPYKDEQGYYAYEKDGDVVYIKSEVVTYGEDIFIKNESGEIVPRTPGKRGWVDSYILEIKRVDYDNNRTYFYIYDTHGSTNTAYGWDKNSLFYTDFYAFYIEETDPNNFIGKPIHQLYKSGSYSPGLVLTHPNKVYTLNKKFQIEYPNEGDVIEGPVTGSMVTIPDNWVEEEPGKYSDPNFVPAYEGQLPSVYWYAGESLDYVKEAKEAVKYRGTIYGMVDEFENDCEYDFKNALITGRYSLFDPDLFYYTFTNLGSTPSLLKSGDEPILLYPGTYSFLGCIPFRYYEDNPYEYYLRVQGKTQEYSDWDLYAAICDTEGYIDEDTGERHYKVNMYTKHDYQCPTSNNSSDSGNNYMVRIFEDRQWYIKELPPEENTYSWAPVIYCKHNGSTEEFNGSLYTTYDSSKYFCHYKGWVYDCDYKHTRTLINLNYNGAHYGSEGSDFDISIGYATFVDDLNSFSNYVFFVYDLDGSYGVHYSASYASSYITWIKQGLPTTVDPSSDSYVIYSSTNYKFTKPITITEPMYIYLSPYNTTATYADAYVLGDVMLSPKRTIETGDIGYDIYCTNRDYSELNGDLYAWSFSVINPKDTSCAYPNYGPDCYRVTLRTSYFGFPGKQIPKVIMDDVLSSTIEAREVFIQDCYCVKARNGYDYGYPYSDTFGNYWSSDNKLFLRNVYFAELLDVDGCTIEDCYCINITRVRNSHIRHYCQSLKANDCQNIILDAVAESTVEHCNDIQVYNVWGSHIFKCFYTGDSSMNIIRGLTDSILYNILNCNINAKGPINYPGADYSKIYINGLKYKDIELSNYLSLDDRGASSSRCVHIRSEDDLTITV